MMLLQFFICMSLIDVSMADIAYSLKASPDYCSTSGCPQSNCSYIQVAHNLRTRGYSFCNSSTSLNKEECFNMIKTLSDVWLVVYKADEYCVVSECDASDKLKYSGTRITLSKTCQTDCMNYTVTKIRNCLGQPGPEAVYVGTFNGTNEQDCYSQCLPPVEPCFGNYDASNKVCNIFTNIDPAVTVPCVQNEAQFSTYVLECVEDYCDPPAMIRGGNVTYVNTSYLSTATYSCYPGHYMIGTPTVTCGSNIEWSTLPSCELVDCGSPPNVSNAVTNVTNTTFSSTVSYICAPGHILIGSSTISCIAGGVWEEPLPTCVFIDCNAPPNITNSSVHYSTTTYGSVATYECLTGQFLLGHQTLSCQVGGNWSIPAFNCSLIDTGYTPLSDYIIPCTCSTGSFINLTNDEIIALLHAHTVIDPRETTLSQFAFKCRQDNRESSMYVGITGITVIISVFMCIVLLDLLTLFK